MKVKSESQVTQSCLILRDPMDCSLPGSSTHGIFQARVLEWGAIAFSSMDVRGGLKRKLSTEELMLLNLVLENTLESSLDCKIQPVNPKGNQS